MRVPTRFARRTARYCRPRPWGSASCRHSRIELANGHRLIAMFLPPESEQVADLLPATIACLCLADPLNRVLTAEAEQWVADPAAPFLEAAKREATLDLSCKPAPAPDREQCSQQLGPPLTHLSANVVLKRSRLRILGARVELHRDEAPSQIFRYAQTVTSHDHEGR